jgi:hypothetical protein
MVFRYRFSIRNEGPIRVTITDAGHRPQGFMISRRVVGMNPDINRPGDATRNFVPFQPFDLAPGVEAGLEIEVRLASDACLVPRSSMFWSTEPIAYRVLGLPMSTRVETGTEIRLIGTRSTACSGDG